MKNKILAGLLLAAMWFAMPCGGQVQTVYDEAAPLFKYPEVPEKLTKVNMRLHSAKLSTIIYRSLFWRIWMW